MNVPETIKSGNPNMARRAFLFTGAAGIASSPFWLGKLFNPSFTPEQQKDIDDVQNFLQKLHTTPIDGIAKDGIEFLDNPQASRCLVHLRQSHGSAGLVELNLAPQLEALTATMENEFPRLARTLHLMCIGLVDRKNVDWLDGIEEMLFKKMNANPNIQMLDNFYIENQSATNGPDDQSIARIITALQSANLMGPDVHLEANFPSDDHNNADLRSRYLTNDTNVDRIQNEMGPFGPNGREEQQKRLKDAKFIRFESEIQLRANSGALFTQVVRGDIVLRGAEGKEEHTKAIAKIDKAIQEGRTLPEYDPVIHRDRENATLDIAMRRKDPIFVTRFGGKHNWDEEIHEWNNTHPPHEQFAMARITPKGYVE